MAATVKKIAIGLLIAVILIIGARRCYTWLELHRFFNVPGGLTVYVR
jgi:hypothetical protein